MTKSAPASDFLDERSGHRLRELAPQVLGAVIRRFRDFASAEDAVQEALLAAATQWPRAVAHYRGVAARTTSLQERNYFTQAARLTESLAGQPSQPKKASMRVSLKFSAGAFTAAFMLLAVSCGISKSANPAASKALIVPSLPYEKYKLSNGLEVILSENHRLPLVAVDLWYHVGPVNEKPGRMGFAHLFEHMMFEGSKHVGEKAHVRILERAGATEINGTTDFDRTNYFETLPGNQLELALWLESDRMGFLLENLDRTRLADQRDVVRNERRQGENSPYSLSDEEMFHLLFPKGHSYYANVIGSHADIEAARLTDVRDFFRQFYTPNNATVVVAGDFDIAKLKPLIEKYFGPIPAGHPVEKVALKTPSIMTERRATLTDTVQLSRVTVAWLTPQSISTGRCRDSTAPSNPWRRQVEPSVSQAHL